MLKGFLFFGSKNDLCNHLASREVPTCLQSVINSPDENNTVTVDENDLIKIFDMVSQCCSRFRNLFLCVLDSKALA